MVDNQHRQIKGYADLEQADIDLINEIKEAEATLTKLWRRVKNEAPKTGQAQRDLAMARTHWEDGFIRAVRAVAHADTPWEG